MIEIVRASPAHFADADMLLNEYEGSLAILRRDSPEVLSAFLSDEGFGYWIAYVDGEPAGCAVLRPLPARGPSAAECKRLYVRPQFRRQGMAGALLDALEVRAAAIGLTWVYLENKDDLRDAYRIYMARGYEATERFNTNLLATIFLRKKLQPVSYAAEANGHV